MKKYLFLILILLLIPISFAKQDIIVQNEENNLTLIYPKFSTYKLGENITFYVHLYNKTGKIVDNTTTTCLFHLYKSDGSHIVEDYMYMDSNGIDFEYEVAKENFSQIGEYAYLISCNNSYGFAEVSNGFRIDTFEDEVEPLGLVIAILGFSAICSYFVFRLDDDHFILKLLFVFFTLIPLIFLPAVFINGVYATAQSFIKIPMGFFILFVTYFSVYVIYHWLGKPKFLGQLLGKNGKDQ